MKEMVYSHDSHSLLVHVTLQKLQKLQQVKYKMKYQHLFIVYVRYM
jgi:hypothetical protein